MLAWSCRFQGLCEDLPLTVYGRHLPHWRQDVGRKNYLHFGSEEGGKTGATLYTLVQSARRNCVAVWPYLTDVLRRIAAIDPGDTRLHWRPCCRIAGWPSILSTDLSSGKKNPVKARLVAVGSRLRVGLLSPNRRC
ncbi:MAG: hypothetical protein ABSG53_20375 [Thermoguttaceae bacterium]